MSDTTPPVPPVPPVPPAPPAAPDAAPQFVVPPAAPNPYAVDPAAPNPYATPAAPNPYAAPAAYAPGQYAPATNTLAIVALVLAFVVPLGGIICGHIALGQIKRTGEGGHGLALAGTVLGYVFVGLGLLIGIIYFVAFFALAANGSLSTYSG